MPVTVPAAKDPARVAATLDVPWMARRNVVRDDRYIEHKEA